MNIKNLRELFPIFNQANPGISCIAYLDNAATTQKPQDVINSICDFYNTSCANIHRGLYPLSEKATLDYEKTRALIAQFIQAQSAAEIVFTKGTTESINLVAHSWAIEHLQKGDVILLSQVEHHANLLPWLEVARVKDLTIRYIPYDPEKKLLNLNNLDLSGVKFLAAQHTSNLLGNVWDNDFSNLKALIKTVKAQQGAVLLDAAQSIAHLPINVQELNVDFLAFSGHKMYGPTGIGILYVHSARHAELKPYQVGGSMLYHAAYDHAVWAKMPQLLEAGTPPIASAIGLGSAINFMKNHVSYQELAHHETALCKKLSTGLALIPGIAIVTEHEKTDHQHIVTFYHETIHAHDLASFLGEKNIAVRAGNHCAQPIIDLLKLPALVRASVALYNTVDDIDALLAALREAITLLSI